MLVEGILQNSPHIFAVVGEYPHIFDVAYLLVAFSTLLKASKPL